MVQHVTAIYSAQDAFNAIKDMSLNKKSHERTEKEDVVFWVWNALYHLQDISTLFAVDPRPLRLRVFDSKLENIWICNCVG